MKTPGHLSGWALEPSWISKQKQARHEFSKRKEHEGRKGKRAARVSKGEVKPAQPKWKFPPPLWRRVTV
jgi:hypothetical protein